MTPETFFNRIETQYKNNLPFIVYRKPGESKLLVLFQEDDVIHETQDFSEKGFVFSPFEESNKSVLIPFTENNFFSTNYQVEVDDYKGSPASNASEASKAFHINLVEKGVAAIKNNDFKKVVLSRKETVIPSEVNPLKIFKRLLNKYASAFVYCFYHPKVGLWLGATPETLIKIEGNQFSIMALAGTQDYNGSLDVVWQDKEIQEQKFVTDYIVDSLKNTVETLTVSPTKTVKAGNLVHLKTMISARLKSETVLKDVITTIHPTPAVCGLPKQASKAFILENEHYKREFYSGFLGELNFETTKAPRSGKRNIENRAYAITTKSTQLYVNLRCMQFVGAEAHIYVGGGVTESSNPLSEWQETVSKSLVIKSVL